MLWEIPKCLKYSKGVLGTIFFNIDFTTWNVILRNKWRIDLEIFDYILGRLCRNIFRINFLSFKLSWNFISSALADWVLIHWATSILLTTRIIAARDHRSSMSGCNSTLENHPLCQNIERRDSQSSVMIMDFDPCLATFQACFLSDKTR